MFALWVAWRKNPRGTQLSEDVNMSRGQYHRFFSSL